MYQIVFAVLSVEVVAISIILAPMPSRWRQKLLLSPTALIGSKEDRMLRLSNSTNVDRIKKHWKLFVSSLCNNLRLAQRALFILILVLFIDSIRTAQKTHMDLHSPGVTPSSSSQQQVQQQHPHVTVRDSFHDTQKYAKMFYAQRNMYLTGITLFLSIVLDRIIHVLALEMKNNHNQSSINIANTPVSGTNESGRSRKGSYLSEGEESNDLRVLHSGKNGSFSSATRRNLVAEPETELPIASSPIMEGHVKLD